MRYIGCRFILSKEIANRKKIAIVMGVAVLSHWFLDSTKIGFGLWNNAMGTYFAGKYGMIIFVLFMLIINVNNIFWRPLVTDEIIVSIAGLLVYFTFSGVAFCSPC